MRKADKVSLAAFVVAILLMAVAVAVRIVPSVAQEEAARLGIASPQIDIGVLLTMVKEKKLSLLEALYYENKEEGKVQCNLCPWKCVLKNGERGKCRVRVNIEGKLRALTYGKPVAVDIDDPIEKKPLFHVMPGTRTLSLSTVGCNLGCIFCQNWQTSQEWPEKGEHELKIRLTREEQLPWEKPTDSLSPEEVIEIYKVTRRESIAFTYTEPTVFFEYMLDICKLARKEGIKTLWITCGYIEPAPLRELCKYLDAANVDLKGFSEKFYQDYCGAHLEPVLTCLKILKEEKVWFEITNLIIPDANDDPQMIRNMCVWIRDNLGLDYPLHLNKFYPAYLLNRRATPVSTLLKARQIAKEVGIRYVYIGNVWEPGLEDTICPSCARTLIRRRGYSIEENNVQDGACKFCRTPIPGIWK
jgi:pyruvate formate lyase activating enzyme